MQLAAPSHARAAAPSRVGARRALPASVRVSAAASPTDPLMVRVARGEGTKMKELRISSV